MSNFFLTLKLSCYFLFLFIIYEFIQIFFKISYLFFSYVSLVFFTLLTGTRQKKETLQIKFIIFNFKFVVKVVVECAGTQHILIFLQHIYILYISYLNLILFHFLRSCSQQHTWLSHNIYSNTHCTLNKKYIKNNIKYKVLKYF